MKLRRIKQDQDAGRGLPENSTETKNKASEKSKKKQKKQKKPKKQTLFTKEEGRRLRLLKKKEQGGKPSLARNYYCP